MEDAARLDVTASLLRLFVVALGEGFASIALLEGGSIIEGLHRNMNGSGFL